MIEPLRVLKLDKLAQIPTRKHADDAGLDFYSLLSYVSIEKGEIAIIPTGIAIELPRGTVGLLKPKSGSNINMLAGVIDSGYRGEIKFKVHNPTNGLLEINYGDPIGQLVILPYVLTRVIEVDELDNFTERGTDGGINRLK